MNYHGSKRPVRAWEYIWYAIVTIVLLAAALVPALFHLAGGVRKLMSRGGKTAFIVLVLIAAAAGYGLWSYYSAVDLGNNTVSLIVAPGDSFGLVASRLEENGVVRSTLPLKIAARIRGVDRKLVPGRYDFSGPVSTAEVLDRLVAGDFLRIKVTIPEGSTIWQVASIMSKAMPVDSATFVALNSDSAFLAQVDKPCLEGYLYPTTYHLPWGLSTREAAVTMVQMFDEQTRSVWPSKITLGLTPQQVVTLASIVEAETSVDSERTIVASVYLNRLRDKWRLDADPTVIYGLGGLDRPLQRRDLRKDTPYNTYLHKGLPPTPINSPRLASIEAVLHPIDTDYFFFVADHTGGHYFSRTNAEHERAIRRIRAQGK